MKTILSLLLLAGLVFSAEAQLATNQSARFPIKVVSYEGKIGSGVSGTAVSPNPETIAPGNETKNTVDSPGHESQLSWVFLGRNQSADVYRFTFTRNTKAGVQSETTSIKECSFDGRQKVLFEDDLHTVVVESPSAKDLTAKEEQRH